MRPSSTSTAPSAISSRAGFMVSTVAERMRSLRPSAKTFSRCPMQGYWIAAAWSTDQAWEIFPCSMNLSDDCYALYLDHAAGTGEARDGQEGAARIAGVGEVLAADLHEPVAVPGVVDEDGHGHQVGDRAAGALEGAVEEGEDRARLLVEFPGDVFAFQVGHRGLSG